MTLCRNPKRKPVRMLATSPLVSVSVAAGCPCSGGAAVAGSVSLYVQRSGERDPTVISYPVYSYNAVGDPTFFLDYQVLNEPGVYDAEVRSLSLGVTVTCGTFQLIIGPACSISNAYPTASPGGGVPGGDVPPGDAPIFLYDDMQPSYNSVPITP